MAKLKLKNGSERLVLKGDEIRLVAAVIEHVRLGIGDRYKEAACRILETLGDSESYDGISYAHGASFAVTISRGNESRTYHDEDYDYETCIEVTEKSDGDFV